jgi:hypothetical protein
VYYDKYGLIIREWLNLSELLLQTMSALGHIDLDRFNRVFNELYRQRKALALERMDFSSFRRQTIRFLDSLGHCEFDFDKRQVFVCPPMLINLPVCGIMRTILTGARTPSIIKRIELFVSNNKDTISFYKEQQRLENILLPSVIHIDSIDCNFLIELTEASHIEYVSKAPASWSLANFSASLSDIKKSLDYEDRVVLNWDKRVFSPTSLLFSDPNGAEDKKLVMYTNPRNQQKIHWMWDGKRAAEIDRYWGRYAILAEEELHILLFDKRRRLLAVPSYIPLPRILARAATLCTGLAPGIANLGNKSIGDIPSGYPLDIYFGVPPNIAEIISQKLLQRLMHQEIRINEMGVLQ